MTAATAVYPENIPAELRAVDHWVCWRIEYREGKATKPPWRADGSGHASATDPQTWTTFARAYQAYSTGDYDGVGIVMTADMGIIGVDLDKVDGWQVEASRILSTLDSYTEITPSQNGYRVYVRGIMPPGARRKGHVEIYNDARFFTVTGDIIGPPEICERTDQLAAVHAEWLGRTVVRPFGQLASMERAAPELSKLSLSDLVLLQRAQEASNGARFSALWAGEAGDDHSGADLALVNHLAFWWGGDPQAIDRMFRLSGLMRDKWDSARGDSSYGAWTIARVLEDLKETYSPGGTTLMTANRGAEVPQAATEEAAAPVKRPYSMSVATDLMAKVIPVAKFAVPGIITEGLNLLAGKPKMGKSWLALGLGIAIASGQPALGSIRCPIGDVLYLALEDSERRLQDRMRQLGAPQYLPRLTLISAPTRDTDPFPRVDQGGLVEIERWLLDNPEARLVIIDTLAMIRTPRSKSGDVYQDDYAAASQLKRLADAYAVAFLVVSHLNKAGSEDFVQAVTGSSGITGASDGILVMARERMESVALLQVTGRDVDEQELALELRGVGNWVVAGSVESVKQSPIRRQIVGVLEATTALMTPAQVAVELNMKPDTLKQRMWQMKQDGVLYSVFGGAYQLSHRGDPKGTPHLPPHNNNNPVTRDFERASGGGASEGSGYGIRGLFEETGAPRHLPNGEAL